MRFMSENSAGGKELNRRLELRRLAEECMDPNSTVSFAKWFAPDDLVELLDDFDLTDRVLSARTDELRWYRNAVTRIANDAVKAQAEGATARESLPADWAVAQQAADHRAGDFE